ncbi:hypothetical protein Tco_0675710 [Tanacetum coccineum]
MTERNDYISFTLKNCISNDNEGRMIEINFVEIQGTFLIKIRDNTLNGAIEENVFEHINKFIEVVRPIKINRVSQDQFRLSIFPISLAGAAGAAGAAGIGTYKEYELNNHLTRDLEEPWLDNGLPGLVRVKSMTYFQDHKCSDIDGFCNGEELPGLVRVGSMTYFQDHKWYDELADGRLKEETLMHKAKFEESWGDATPSVIKLCAWLINSFRNFHELDYNVLVKLQGCWWEINAHEVAPFTSLESYGQRPYANFKTEKAHDPYLEINNMFGRNYDTSDTGNTQDNQGNEERINDPALEPSVCKIRRFKKMKYSFNADEEYIAIKESEYLNHSKDNLNAYR